MPATQAAPTSTEDQLLAQHIEDMRAEIRSLEDDIRELSNELPKPGHTEDLWIPKDQVAGISVQLRMDKEYLALRRSDLRRLERTARHRRRAAA